MGPQPTGDSTPRSVVSAATASPKSRSDSLAVSLTPAMYDVFTRYALGAEASRSELARELIGASLTDPEFDLIVSPKTWTLELECREMLASIKAANHEENCTRCGKK